MICRCAHGGFDQVKTERAALSARDRFGSKLRSRARALFAIGKLDVRTTRGLHRNTAKKRAALAERALQLQPDLPEAHLALGFSYYYGDNNYEAALREFEIAQRGLPNESEVYLAIGAIQRRQGKWAESTANLEKAASLNPKDTWPLQNLTFNYRMLRNFDAANKTIDRALALDPTAMEPLGVKSQLAIAEKGDFSVAETGFEALKSIPMTNEQKLKTADARADVFLLERRYSDGLREAESLSDDQLASYPTGLWSKYYHIGFARRALQDEPAARAAFLKAKSAVENNSNIAPTSPSCAFSWQKSRVSWRKRFRDGGSATCERVTARK